MTGGTTTGTPKLLDGKATAKVIRAEVAEGVAALKAEQGVTPGLVVVQVGDDPASQIYARNKQRAAERAGMRSAAELLPTDAGDDDLLRVVRKLNDDPRVHGILIQLPLPDRVDNRRVIESIDPRKDVDGFHPENVGRVQIGAGGFAPCTPAGIIRLLHDYQIPLEGRHAVVIGRSNIVGKPMALLLLREHCTVTVCHSRTLDLPQVAARADVLIAAVGRAGLVTAEFIKPGAAVVDVGIHRVDDEALCRAFYGEDARRLTAVRERGSTLVGDVHPLQARTRAGWLSPVPGGVGPLTIAWLLRNTLDAARALAAEPA